jgi:hypothetical protein
LGAGGAAQNARRAGYDRGTLGQFTAGTAFFSHGLPPAGLAQAAVKNGWQPLFNDLTPRFRGRRGLGTSPSSTRMINRE